MDLVIAPGTSGAHSKFRSDSASALPADEHIYSSSVAMDVPLTGGPSGPKVVSSVLPRTLEIPSGDRAAGENYLWVIQ